MPETSIYTVGNYPDRFLTCRILMHPWREDGLPWVEVKTEGGTEVQVVYERLTCPRCGMHRVDQRSMQGRFLRRSYRPPTNYRLETETRGKEGLAGERIRRLLSNVQRAV